MHHAQLPLRVQCERERAGGETLFEMRGVEEAGGCVGVRGRGEVGEGDAEGGVV